MACDWQGYVHPIVALAWRRNFSDWTGRYPVAGQSLRDYEEALPRQLRHSLAEALFDWVVWLRDRGCTPGITTALLNGERDKILALIDAELTEEGESSYVD